ncbi:putative expressed protein [Lyophyllum shimeji]|uniref:Expressed protein n=1 Tax=Lyophyllum shimeji TaxID=47721 RepID=A0A9P3PYR6_LYOSH|nr:putative expressed protein [Lyophyllum shimeji]
MIPPETLLMIFELVFEASIPLYDRAGLVQELPEEMLYGGDNRALYWGDDDLQSPAPFPFALSAVCTAWRDLMSTVPMFWTRLVIFVGGPDATPIRDVRQYLQWSRQLSVSVHILNRSEYLNSTGTHVDHARDQEYVRELMDVLAPHFHRLQLLTCDLLGCPELAGLLEAGHRRGSRLAGLTVVCEYLVTAPHDADGGPAGAKEMHRNSSKVDRSKVLFISASSLAWFLDRFPYDWVDGESDDFRLDFTLSDPPPPLNEGEGVDLHNLIECLGGGVFTTTVWLCNVPLTWQQHDPVHQSLAYDWHDADMVVEELPPGAVEEIIDCLDDTVAFFHSFEVVRCPIGEPHYALLSERLVLDGLIVPGPTHLVPFVRHWDGKELEMRNCPAAAVDAVLDMVAAADDENEETNETNAMRLRTLRLRDCGAFSFAKLRRAVDARDAKAQAQRRKPVPEWEQMRWPPLSSIVIQGQHPTLSADDAAWARENRHRCLWV